MGTNTITKMVPHVVNLNGTSVYFQPSNTSYDFAAAVQSYCDQSLKEKFNQTEKKIAYKFALNCWCTIFNRHKSFIHYAGFFVELRYTSSKVSTPLVS